MHMLPFFHFTFINIDILLLPQVRLNALNTLYQFPLSDELTSKNSDGIRKGLLAALADEDEQLAVCSNLCFKDKILYIFLQTSVRQTIVTGFVLIQKISIIIYPAGELLFFIFV